MGGGGRPRPAPNSIWSLGRMDFSCYILSQCWPTPLPPKATTQVQQQIGSLCSRQQIQIQKSTSEVPPAPSIRGWAEGDTGEWGGREGGGSQQIPVSNAEVTDSMARGLLWGEGSRGKGIIAFAEGRRPPSPLPASGNWGGHDPQIDPRPQGDKGTSLAADAESVRGGGGFPLCPVPPCA